MNLLFQRSQSSGGASVLDGLGIRSLMGRPKFKLWGKIELEPDEQAVLDHYHFDKAVLIDSFQPELMRSTAYVTGGAFLGALVLLFAMFSFSASLFLAVIAAAIASYLYYDKKRETVFVSDLLHGRYFDCKSVIELARKEAWLGLVTSFLRQVMESAKHWDGTETQVIAALDKEEAKRIIIKGL